MNKQLTIFDAVGDSDHVSPTNELGDTKKQAIERYLARAETKQMSKTEEPGISIEEYCPNGRKTKYFRLKYRIGKRTITPHIPGGNIHAKLAQYRAKELQKMIDRGASLGEIIAAVETYGS